MGDSAITETFGIGGAAMIAAPGVTRFVGAGEWKRRNLFLKRWLKFISNATCSYKSPAGIFRGLSGTGYPPRGRDRNYAAD